jgi:hypothetical protein
LLKSRRDRTSECGFLDLIKFKVKRLKAKADRDTGKAGKQRPGHATRVFSYLAVRLTLTSGGQIADAGRVDLQAAVNEEVASSRTAMATRTKEEEEEEEDDQV